jgi:hypothetical protein
MLKSPFETLPIQSLRLDSIRGLDILQFQHLVLTRKAYEILAARWKEVVS